MHTLDKHFRDLTKAAFARHGFAQSDLMAQWPAIVGEQLALHSRPERIKWPRGASEANRKLGGTLVIRAAAGRGLDLQHETPSIIERINRFYGFGAIAAISILQDARALEPGRPRSSPKLDPADLQALTDRLERVADPGLKAALGRLGEGALGGRPKTTARE